MLLIPDQKKFHRYLLLAYEWGDGVTGYPRRGFQIAASISRLECTLNKNEEIVEADVIDLQTLRIKRHYENRPMHDLVWARCNGKLGMTIAELETYLNDRTKTYQLDYHC